MFENEDKFEEIIDVTGIKLTPSENGTKCRGNGEHFGENGERIECCCDECDLNRSNAPALLAKSRACERLQLTPGALAPQAFSGRL